MSDQILPDEYDDEVLPPAGGRRRKRRGIKGCLAVIVALAVVVGGFYFVVTKGVDLIRNQFASAQDFAGPGRGQVTFQVNEGDSVAEIGRNLKKVEVVASVESFTNAAAANPASTGIQVGYYGLKKAMKASDALEVLLDPANIIKNTVTIPEGLRVTDIIGILADKTDFSREQFQKVLDNPADLGLPDYANDNPEGYLFPATYDLGPKDNPKSILQAMVTRWQQSADDLDLEGAAARLGYTPAELMVVASLVEAEGRGDTMPKIARVIYNRITTTGAPTYGLLQIDATVNYALDRELIAIPTTEDTQVDSPYNTYKYPGLPPGPIEAPGDASLQAATKPADGNWLFYVTVNLKTGETKFTDSYDEFLTYKGELRTYCETSDAC